MTIQENVLLKNLHENRVKFPDIQLDIQHGDSEVTCKPAIAYWWAAKSRFNFFLVIFRSIKFGNNGSSQYLISITNQYLTVWNLLSCSGKL